MAGILHVENNYQDHKSIRTFGFLICFIRLQATRDCVPRFCFINGAAYRLYISLLYWPKGDKKKREEKRRRGGEETGNSVANKEEALLLKKGGFVMSRTDLQKRGRSAEYREGVFLWSWRGILSKPSLNRREREEEETRERQGKENHNNDTVKSKENTEARATTPPAQHAFIAVIFVISRESINRRRENEQRPKPAWPSLLLSLEAATIGWTQKLQHLSSSSIQRQLSRKRKQNREGGKEKRRK